MMTAGRPNPLEKIDVVLVRPLRPGNIGASARAMKNMGARRLVLVDPVRPRSSEAYRMAYGAREILDRATVVTSLPDAVSKARLVVGTTVRQRKGYGPIPSLLELIPEILSRAARDRVALVFGSERTGLSNRDIAVCQKLVSIPVAPVFPSLNLGHAVMVVLYELFKAAAGSFQKSDRPLAPSNELERFYRDLEGHLSRIGFIKGPQGRFIMEDLRRIFGRAGLDSREVRILRGVISQSRWAAARESGGDEP